MGPNKHPTLEYVKGQRIWRELCVTNLQGEHKLVGFAFVDDTDLILLDMLDASTDFEELAGKMLEAINMWEGELKATRGALVPHKSWICPIDFKKKEQKLKYTPATEIEQQFTVKDQNEEIKPLQKVDLSEGREMLGIFLASDGNNNKVVERLTAKAQEWHDNILLGHISRDLAWQASQTTIMKTLEYPLVALTLSEEDCNKIMKPVKTATLAKTSINRNYPSAILYRPKKEGGLVLNNLYITQGLIHLQKLQQHLGSNSITDKLIKVSLELAILEVGVGRNLFDLQYNKFSSLVTEGWIKGIWKFVSEKGIGIIDRTTKYPAPQREGDVFLTEIFVHAGYSRSELAKLNQCRMYLKALTLSDIMHATGNSFTTAYNLQRDEFYKTRYNWPNQTRPGTAAKKLWRSALRKCFGMKKGITTYTLGTGLYQPSNCWIWSYEAESQLLYQQFRRVFLLQALINICSH